MPRLSKSAPGHINDGSSTSASSGVATPTRPEVQLRRSNRRISQDTREEDKTREIQAKVLGIRPDGEDKQHSDDEKDRKETVREGVQLAIEGLARMERRLKRATKQQKNQVEASVFQESLDRRRDDDHDAVEARGVTLRDAEPLDNIEGDGPSAKEMANKKVKKRASNSENVHNPDGPFAEVKSEDAVDIERGAARPPPVNSSYLPLPWTGRLGYVISPHRK